MVVLAQVNMCMRVRSLSSMPVPNDVNKFLLDFAISMFVPVLLALIVSIVGLVAWVKANKIRAQEIEAAGAESE